MFQYPSYELGNVAFTAIGAAVFWSRWGHGRLKVYGLSRVVAFLPLRPKLQEVVEFSVFVVLGCVIGIGVANPANVPQALSAGMGWTGFLTTRR